MAEEIVKVNYFNEINNVKTPKKLPSFIDEDEIISLIESTREMAILYPRYLQPRFKNDEQFSQQEIDILYLLQQGKNQEEIGEYFFISVNTVKYHLKKIYTKLNAENANQAVWNAKLLGLIR